jgi:hypothetical protein
VARITATSAAVVRAEAGRGLDAADGGFHARRIGRVGAAEVFQLPLDYEGWRALHGAGAIVGQALLRRTLGMHHTLRDTLAV